jgi:hypothetical protein
MKQLRYDRLLTTAIDPNSVTTVGAGVGIAGGLVAALIAVGLGASGEVPGIVFFGGIFATITVFLTLWDPTAIYDKAVKNFARANKLAIKEVSLADLPSTVVPKGAKNQKIEHAYTFELTDATHCVVYDYIFWIGSGKSETQCFTPVLQFHVSAKFPELFLDGRQNGYDSNYLETQKLSLEGNFDDYFDLYVLHGEQIDALSVITPDIMQLLVDSGRPYDIALKGNDVYIFSSGHFFYTRRGLPHVLEFAKRLLEELEHRSKSWQDPLPGTPSKQLKSSLWRFPKLWR